MGFELPIREKRLLKTAVDAAAFFTPHIAHAREEKLAIVYLDAKQFILGFHVKSDHAVGHVSAPIRDIVAEALHRNARSLIIAHNHPSGIPLPSPIDKDLTRLLVRTLRPIGLQLQDHLIFAGQQWTSFRGLGLL